MYSKGKTRGSVYSKGKTRGSVYSKGKMRGSVYSKGKTRGSMYSKGKIRSCSTLLLRHEVREEANVAQWFQHWTQDQIMRGCLFFIECLVYVKVLKCVKISTSCVVLLGRGGWGGWGG